MNFSSGTDEIQSEKERFLENLGQILEEQVISGGMLVSLVSYKMGVSQSTLYRKIKYFTGLSPGEYIKEFKLKKAAKYLNSDFGNVSEVAYEAGFNNLSYFSKCFKERFGVTPGKYAAGELMHNNLPEHLTSFVGREQELTDIKELINDHRLINLTGPAGTGKTRLALETLNQVKDDFAHGILIVHLASLSDPGLIPSAILHELNIKKKPVQSSFENLIEHLKSREVLILLDNIEHLTAAAHDVNTLLRYCPDLTIMVTSREKLHLSGEYSYSVSPLSIPDTFDSISESTLNKIKKYPSVKLFLERAETITGNFQLNVKNIPDIIRICQYLDGLPLALELAASQIHMISLHSLAGRLKENLSVLKTGDIDRPERHQTLLNAINWSYNLLTEQEKLLFQRLSLFAGSFDINAAEAVWSDPSGEPDILDRLRSLVDKNFLQTFEAGGEVRFRLLETLKIYGHEKLIESRDEKEVLTKMAVHFLQMAQKAEIELKGVRQEYWVNRLGMELDNFRGILSALEQYRKIELGLQLSTALWRYWNMQNMNKEGCEWLEKMIDLANNLKFHEESDKTNILKGKALSARGIMGLMITENMKEYTEIFRQCIIIFRKNDQKKELAENLNHYGWVNAVMGDYKRGTMISKEAMELHKQLNDIRGMAVSYNNLGWMEYTRGNLLKAADLFLESISLRDNIGDHRGSAFVSTYMSLVERCLGRYNSAFSRLKKAEEILEELEDIQILSMVYTVKGYVLYDIGEYHKSCNVLEIAIESWLNAGNHFGLYLSYDLLGLSLLSLEKQESANHYIESARSGWSGMNINWAIPFSFYCTGEYNAGMNQIEQALLHHKKALSLRIEQEEKLYICESLEACAGILIDRDYNTAVTYLSVSEAMRNRIRAPLPPRIKETIESLLSRSKRKMGKSLFEKTWDKGQDLSLAQLKI